MSRFLAGAAAAFLFLTGAFLLWQGRAEQAAPLAPPPRPRQALAPISFTPPTQQPAPPEATRKSREEKRFARADKDDNGRITAPELYEPRRRAFAKLDRNGNGTLSFDEWAIKTIDKFASADQDRSGWLSRIEYATTAPKPRKQPACAC